MQDPTWSSTPITMDGTIEARAMLKVAYGEEVQDEGWAENQLPLPSSVCFDLSQRACNGRIRTTNPLDIEIIKSMFEPILSEYELIYCLK